MVLFTHNVKKAKGAAHKNDDVDGTCKQTLKVCSHKTFAFNIELMVTQMQTQRMGVCTNILNTP